MCVYVSIYSYCSRVKIIKLVMAPRVTVYCASYTTTSRVGRQTTTSFYGYVNESRRRSFTGGLRTTGRVLKYYFLVVDKTDARRRINNTESLHIIIILWLREARIERVDSRRRLIHVTAKTNRVSIIISKETEGV